MKDVLPQFSGPSLMADCIRLFCASNPDESALAGYYSNIAFDDVPSSLASAISSLAAKTEYRGVPEGILPRLKGMRRYANVLNAGQQAAVKAVSRCLNQEGIEPVFLYDTALRARHPNVLLRPMWQSDMGLVGQDYARVPDLLVALGFEVERNPYNVSARMGNAEHVVLHPVDAEGYLIKGAKLCETGDMRCFLPDDAATLLLGAGQVLLGFASQDSLVYFAHWIFDAHPIVSGADFDWGLLMDYAKASGLGLQARLVLQAYSELMAQFGEALPYSKDDLVALDPNYLFDLQLAKRRLKRRRAK